jgi:threonine/homoserine/homoserine lactone efflux protein
MSEDATPPTRSDRDRGRVAALVAGVGRLLGDLLAVSLWVLFLTLVFLETSWPRWAFYLSLVAGVAVYVAVTAAWTGGGERE